MYISPFSPNVTLCKLYISVCVKMRKYSVFDLEVIFSSIHIWLENFAIWTPVILIHSGFALNKLFFRCWFAFWFYLFWTFKCLCSITSLCVILHKCLRCTVPHWWATPFLCTLRFFMPCTTSFLRATNFDAILFILHKHFAEIQLLWCGTNLCTWYHRVSYNILALHSSLLLWGCWPYWGKQLRSPCLAHNYSS